MNRFNRRGEDAAGAAPGRAGDIADPAVPDALRRLVRPTPGKAYPYVLWVVGRLPRVLVAARPEALVHVSFTEEGDESTTAAYSVAFVPWTQVEEVRVSGVSITFRWSGHSVVVETRSHDEALQTGLFFLDAARGR